MCIRDRKIIEAILLIGATLGILLLANGLFHAMLYLADSKPLLMNLRYINWLSLVFGILLLIPTYKVFKA